jgi:hypothetical protein
MICQLLKIDRTWESGDDREGFPLKFCYLFKIQSIKKGIMAGRQWLTPVILATQEAEIRRITVRSYPKQIVHETLF